MKKFLILFALIFLISFLSPSYAQEQESTAGAPTTSPTKGVPDKIQELKDRVASRVAALKKEKMGALLGSVKSSSDGALILIYKDSEYSIQLEEEGKVYSLDSQLRKKEIKLSSLEKDQKVVVIGSVDNDKKIAIAKVVVLREANVTISGRVASVSTKDGTVTIVGNDEKTYTVDIEITTKSNAYDPKKETLVKIGLSKIEEGTRIQVYGTKGKEENQITALRLLVLPKNTTTPSPSPSPSPKATPTKAPSPTISE